MTEQTKAIHQVFMVEEMAWPQRVHTDDVFQWLAKGWADTKALKGVSMTYAALFLCVGIYISFGFYYLELPYLILPSLSGFLLVGPAFAVGFYEASRRRQAGEDCSLVDVLFGFKRNTYAILGIGLAQVFLFMVWIRLSFTLFAVAFPGVTLELDTIAERALSMEGVNFALMIATLGFCFACIIFLSGAFSLPLMVDHQTLLIPALLTSAYAVIKNIRVMVLWAFLVVLLMFAGLITGIGLIVTFPLIGHATWHAYQQVIQKPNESEPV
jgi:uncharacterized membrane protein